MAVRLPRPEDEPGARAADDADHLELGRPVGPEAAVAEVQRDAERRAQDRRGATRLFGPGLGRAARPRLSARQVADADAVSAPRERRERPAAPELEIVRVGAEGEDVDGGRDGV